MRARREAQGISLETLALRLGMRVRGLQRVEAGSAMPRANRLLAIAAELHIDESELRACVAAERTTPRTAND